MSLTNAERQARHRERQKEKLRNAVPAEPLRNSMLDAMRKAFDDSHRKAVEDAVEGIDRRPLLAGESDWYRMREHLLACPDGFMNDEKFFIELARASGEKLGNYLVMSIYRDFLAEQVRSRRPEPAPAGKKPRKRVT